MADTSPNLAFTRIQEGQDAAEVNVNGNFNIIDAILCGGIVDRNLSAAPAGVNGNVYIVDGTPAGGDPWEGQGGNIAAYYDGWIFITPKEGCRVWVNDEDVLVHYNGTSWTTLIPVSAASGMSGTGAVQAGATPILNRINEFSTITGSDSAAVLPAAAPGLVVTVINNDASDTMLIYPASGDSINSLAVDASYSLPAGAIVTIYAVTTSNWKVLLGS